MYKKNEKCKKMRYILYQTVINVIFYTLDSFYKLLHLLGRQHIIGFKDLPKKVGKIYNGPKRGGGCENQMHKTPFGRFWILIFHFRPQPLFDTESLTFYFRIDLLFT
jgi:hypothetical protein